MLSKQDILELYLNAIYLGRGSWGVEMAARSYFGKSAKELSLADAALLAGITEGPNFYNPERHPDRARERVTYVLGRMQAESFITSDQVKSANGGASKLCRYERARRDSGFHFLDQVAREAKSVGVEALNSGGMVVRSTIRPDLQRAAELRVAGWAGALRGQYRPRTFPRAGDQSRRRGCEDRRGQREQRRRSRHGSRRSKRRGCRSTTCTGRRRLFSAPAGRAKGCASGLPMGAFCRSAARRRAKAPEL